MFFDYLSPKGRSSRHVSLSHSHLQFPPPPRRLTNVHRPRQRVRLELERLEDRLVPAALALTINALTDTGAGILFPGTNAGSGDLRFCLNEAEAKGNAGSTIATQTGLNGTINLTKSLPVIAQNTTILGSGSSSLYVSGGGSQNPFTIFQVNANVTAEIDGLTVENGYANGANGGGVYNSGQLTLKNDFFYSNEAVENNNQGGNGGAIINSGGATLEINSSDFAQNSATGFGGAILNLGTLTCYKTNIYANNAYNGAGLANLNSVVGNAATDLLAGTQIYSNTATNFGGGIYEGGGTVTMSGFSSGGTISGNEAAFLFYREV